MQHESQTRIEGAVRLQIHAFTTDYKSNEDGSVREVDLVEYSPAGQEALMRIKRPVAELLDLQPNDDPNNTIVVQAWQRRKLIEPAYKAWKGGSDVIVSGTPLGAWPAINSRAAEIIRHAGIHSVEDLATASESQIMRIRLPDQQNLRQMARRFLEMKPQAAEAGKLGQLEADNQRLKEQLAELTAMVRSLAKPAATAPDDDESGLGDFSELSDDAVRQMAEEAGVARAGNKSRKTLIAELEAMTKAEEGAR